MKPKSIFLTLITLFYFAAAAQGNEKELRGVWLTKTASQVLMTKQNLAAAMDSLRKTGINVIFPGIFEHGYTLYPSNVMEKDTGKRVHPFFQSRDLLMELITEAHRVGIEVHPWFEFGFAAGFGSKGPILERHPDWAGKRSRTGNEVDDDNFYWLSQAHPEVRQFLIELVLELINTYDVDGIHLDRIRYGNVKSPGTNNLITSDFGYDDAHVQRYRAENNNQDPPTQAWNGPWMKWRSQLLDEFCRAVYDSVKARRPDIMVSNAPVVYPYGYNNFMQNWPEWVKQNSLDFVVPQVYRYDLNAYTFEIEKIQREQLPANYDRFYPGILIRSGSYQASAALVINFIQSYRQRGLQGGVFWFYEGLPAVMTSLQNSVFQLPAQVPNRPENWRPEALIIQDDAELVNKVGDWNKIIGSGSTGFYSSDNQVLVSAGGANAKLVYAAQISTPGFYDIFIYQPFGTDLAENVPIYLPCNGQFFRLDQTQFYSYGWTYLSGAFFETGRFNVLELSTVGVPANKIVAADGMMLILNRRLTNLKTSTDDSRKRQVPETIVLAQNYPNPFNPYTTIDFYLPTAQKIRLEVLNIRGRRVAVLADGFYPSGSHQVSFDGSKLATGVYFYRLLTNGRVQTRKMTVIK